MNYSRCFMQVALKDGARFCAESPLPSKTYDSTTTRLLLRVLVTEGHRHCDANGLAGWPIHVLNMSASGAEISSIRSTTNCSILRTESGRRSRLSPIARCDALYRRIGCTAGESSKKVVAVMMKGRGSVKMTAFRNRSEWLVLAGSAS